MMPNTSPPKSARTQRPLFCVATTHVAAQDRPAARWLGELLYDRLARDREDPLSFGPGIPVAIDVDVQRSAMCEIAALADRVLLIFVAGPTSLLLAPDETTLRLNAFGRPHEDPPPVDACQLTKMLVPTDARWPYEAERMDEVEISRGMLVPENLDGALDAVLRRIGAILLDGQQRPRLLISEFGVEASASSRSASQFGGAPGAPETVQSRANGHAVSTGYHSELWDYFSAVKHLDATAFRHPQASSRDGSDLDGPDHVYVCLHRSDPGAVRLHDRELVAAKQRGWTTVVIPPDQPHDWNTLLRRAAGEHLQRLHFRKLAQRVIDRGWLPVNTPVLSRPPELSDLFSGPLRAAPTRTVIHPDPALTPQRREALRRASPRLNPVTPSNLLFRSGDAEATATLAAPLDPLCVGLSVSNIPEEDYRVGQTAWHLQDATVQLTRTLIGGGAALAYGGNFVLGQGTSFTPLLAELIEAYSETARSTVKRLQVFQSAECKLSEVPSKVRCWIRHLALSEDLAEKALFRAEDAAELPCGMLTSDMRRIMTNETHAKVAIGGQPFPHDGETTGYRGRFPGIAEEVFRALQVGQPVYLCGGFGGITARIAQLWEQPTKIDAFWDEATYQSNRGYVHRSWMVDQHPRRAALGLPSNLMALATRIADAAPPADADQAWLRFNGLTWAQNQQLWHSVDPILISSLIAEGLIQCRSQLIEPGMLRIEAIQGDIVTVSQTDLLAVAVFDDVEPQGAGAAIDRVTGEMVTQAQSTPGRLVGVRGEQLDVDYLCVISLGRVTEMADDHQKLGRAIEQGVAEMVALCLRERLRSIAIVTFGGASLSSYPQAVERTLAGLLSRGEGLLIKWVEANPEKYQVLVDTLERHESVDVTPIVRESPRPTPSSAYPWFILTIRYENEKLHVTALPRQGNARIPSWPVPVSQAQLEAFGKNGRGTPPAAELRKRGLELGQLIFGNAASEYGCLLDNTPLAIVHDEVTSKIPFELLCLQRENSQEYQPAVEAGMHRWLAASDPRPTSPFARPRLTRRLRVGLVVDPTDDLPGARREGEQVQNMLKALGDDVQLHGLGTDGELSATLEHVEDLLRQVDVLHYCGHAQFDQHAPEKSGLVLEDGVLTAVRMRSISPIPRVVIFNACEAGRVRGQPRGGDHPTASLAELLLRCGVEAFLGTYWEVDDAAAEKFAGKLYGQLAGGETLRAAVTTGRAHLQQHRYSDWANYILYGDGRFRLA